MLDLDISVFVGAVHTFRIGIEWRLRGNGSEPLTFPNPELIDSIAFINCFQFISTSQSFNEFAVILL